MPLHWLLPSTSLTTPHLRTSSRSIETERSSSITDMNSDKIDRFLRSRLRDFDGVFSVDNLPEDPHLLVCNTDPSDKPGRHMVAIYIENGRGDFFDSFGRRPNADFER